MRLYGYVCPECEARHRTVEGHRRPDGALSIRCPACRAIDVIRRYRNSLPKAVVE